MTQKEQEELIRKIVALENLCQRGIEVEQNQKMIATLLQNCSLEDLLALDQMAQEKFNKIDSK